MSRNERSKLQERAGQRKQQGKQRRKPDRRIRRTCERLGSALVALIQERPIADVTGQELLDRASALAGSILSLLRWWLGRGAKESPRAMDELFHRMVWNGLK